MLYYILRRALYMLLLLVVLSMVAFAIIQLPPGDYLNSYIQALAMRGAAPDEAELAALKRQYGLDLPFHLQYLKWASRALTGDFGRSMDWRKPVSELIAAPHAADGDHERRGDGFHLRGGDSGRDFRRHPPVLGR